MVESNNKPASSTKKRYEITRNDLPLSCPTKDMRIWDAHPRVYLPIEETGHEICPYCEAEFILIDSCASMVHEK